MMGPLLLANACRIERVSSPQETTALNGASSVRISGLIVPLSPIVTPGEIASALQPIFVAAIACASAASLPGPRHKTCCRAVWLYKLDSPVGPGSCFASPLEMLGVSTLENASTIS